MKSFSEFLSEKTKLPKKQNESNEEIRYDDLIVGEDEYEICHTTVDGVDDYWNISNGQDIFVRNIQLTGKENPISKPTQTIENGIKGVRFDNPGKKLENLPDGIREKCLKFIQSEVERYLDGYDDMIKQDIADKAYDAERGNY